MSLPTAAQLAIRHAAKDFAAEIIMPQAAAFDRSGAFHAFLLEAAKPSKIFAMAAPARYGGLGYDPLAQALVLEQWGYGCAAMGTTLAASTLSLEAVLLAGTDDQKRRYVASLLTGEVGAFCLTEPDAGSDVSAGKTTAVKAGDDYVLNGSKCWITNGSVAADYVIFARTDASKGAKGLSAFIVERGRAGVEIGQVEHKLGLRSSNTVFLRLNDVHAPVADLLGRPGDGMAIAMQALDIARPAIGALAVGLAQRCLDECVAHLKNRFTGQTHPGQSMAFKLADMQIQVEAARQVVHHTMDLRQTGAPFSTDSAIAKTLATDVAMRVTTEAVRLMGSWAYTSELGKFMRDAKVMQIYEGSNEIQRLVIARAVLDLMATPTLKAGRR
jgi:alkylation response protein AidB-like acyl-CoA dehydrogenase